MKLTKKLEAEILKLYNAFWDFYLKGDMKSFTSMLDENCTIIGSSENEVFNNKNEAVKFYKATAAQIAGKAEYRNRKISMMPVGGSLMVNEQLDFFVLIDRIWTFYGNGRISTHFQKKNNKWKIIHMHGSLPDSRAGKGQQVNTEKIKAENIQLRDAVKRRTLELEEKNRELEIETALERVRTVAMGMKEQADMLEVCKVISNQLQKLKIKDIRNIQTAIINEAKGTYLNYEYFTSYKKTSIIEVEIKLHPTVKEFAKQVQKSKDAFFTKSFRGKALKDWQDYVKKTNQIPDPILNKATSIHYNFFSIGAGALGISTYSPLSKEHLALFERFTNVFRLAYSRFTDIQLAMAQAREAKIEVALERVRARTMAMQKSEELPETSYLLFQQLKELGETAAQLSMGIMKEKEGIVELSATVHGSQLLQTYQIPIDEPSVMKKAVKAWKAEKKALLIQLAGKELKDYNNWRNSHLKKKLVFPESQWNVHIAFFSKGLLSFSSDKKLTNETLQLLERFAGVFDQTYIRFLDLQKAEEQAKEAEIELALERVRAKTMAMQKSEELQGTTLVLFQQFKALGATTAQVSICIFDEKVIMGEMYVTLKGEKIDRSFPMQIDKESFVMKKARKAFLYKQKTFSVSIKGKQLQEYNRWRNLLIGKKGWDESETVRNQAWYVNGVFFSRGMMGISSPMQPSDEALKLLERFGNVFDLTFTRFLDLQKAEAQGREAQIQLALERVRARTMAMQKSDELSETSYLLFEQFRELGQTADQISIGIIKEEEGIVEMSATIHGNQVVQTLRVPLNDPIVMKRILHGWKSGEKSMVIDLSGKELNEYNAWRNTLGKFIFDTNNSADDHWVIHAAIHSKGILSFSSNQPSKPETLQLLERFAAVFDLTYTRFLDLKQAESQVRESQIQLALERVRARTMAMHQSTELAETASVLFQQIKELGFDMWSCGFCIWTKDDLVEAWMSADAGGLLPPLMIPYKKEPTHREIYEASLRGEPAHEKIWEGKALQKHYEFLKTIPSVKEAIDILEKSGLTLPPRQCYYVGFFKKGYLLLITKDPTAGALDLSRRFAQVFDLTYTRFLDLQKAEAQGREAQIELGLERVRARAMAMQKSDELSELVDTVFKELTKLDFALTWCIINIIDEPSMSNMVWAASPEIDKAPDSYNMKFEDYPFHHAMMKGWKERKAKYVYTLEGREKKNYDEYLFNETEFRKVPETAQAASRAMKKYVVTFSFSNFGGLQTVGDVPLSDANLDILSRFGKVFDLTYTRFNDLKQAEAQGRESQIQLALERVRARTMAMQRSEDLMDTASLLFRQIADLGTKSWSSGFIIFQPEDLTINSWMSKPDGSIGVPFNIPLTEDPFFMKIHEAMKRGEEFFVFESGGKELEETYRYMFSLPGASKALGAIEEIGFQMPKFQITHCAFFPQGFLMFITYEPVPELWDIFRRFGKVFEQTYTRFTDLQKAEAQAREAQIEAALERVRSRSMGMQKSEELKEVIQVVYDQFVHLNILIEHTGFIMDYKARDDMHIWLADRHEVPSEVTIPYFDCAHWNSFNEAREKGTDFFANHLSFEEKNKFYQDLFKLIPGIPQDTLEYYFSCPGLAISTVLLENVGLYIENFSGIPYTVEENNTLMRFGKVFQQTYTRFLDLQKAEAQTREAKIEAALEKVRSRSLAMHKSEELSELVVVLFDKMNELGVTSDGININVMMEGTKAFESWLAAPGHLYAVRFHVPYFKHPVTDDFFAAIEAKKELLTNVYTYEEKNSFFNYLYENTDFRNLPEDRKQLVLGAKSWEVSIAFTKNTALSLHSYSGKVFSDHENDVLKRFAKVFEQSYIRFRDLQKAEAQAKEAQIELSLERVRARAMAMHKSEELVSASDVLFNELKTLGIETIRTGIGIIGQEKEVVEIWSRSELNDQGENKILGAIPVNSHPFWTNYYEAWKQKEAFSSFEIIGEEVEHFYKINSQFLSYPERTGFNPRESIYGFYFPEGALNVVSHRPLREDECNIMVRFARVFGLTYKRFLDLKNAEAQAREAQIEAALEKVRSRSLAMHNSQELQEVVNSVVERFKELKLDFDAANILIFDETSKGLEMWTATTAVSYSTRFLIPYSQFEYFQRIAAARDAEKDVFTLYYTFKEKNEFFDFLFRETNFSELPEDRKKHIYACECMSLNIALIKNIGIQIISYSRDSFSNEEAEVLKRFTKVFDQAYTRFLDLQKAEAQARESQIEAALERVRSRAMAMHKTNELFDAADVVNRELNSLGVASMNISYAFIDKGEKSASYYGPNPVDGKISPVPFSFPHTETEVMSSILTSWKKQEPFGVIELDKNATIKHQTWAGGYIQYWMEKNNIDTRFSIEEFLAVSPVTAVIYSFNFKYGYLFIIGEEHLSAEQEQMLPRFTKVFELAYRRFLDLNQAEAQAREAQIEASLERVRSKTMAMHNSEGVGETVSTLFDELIKLGIENTIRCGIGIMQDNYQMEAWTARPNPGGPAQLIIGQMNMSLHPLLKGAYDGWKNKSETYSYEISGQGVIDYYTVLNNQPGWPMTYDLESLPPNLYHNDFYFPEGDLYTFSNEKLPEEAKRIFKRFAAVFGQTYRRYLDLQKAEAQAREAQIEASLERVRAQTMAMHSSEDVSMATATMFTELERLGVESLRGGITIIHPDMTQEVWSVNKLSEGKTERAIGIFDMRRHAAWREIFEAWKDGKKDLQYYFLAGKDKQDYIDILNESPNYLKDPIKELPDLHIQSYFFGEGGIWCNSLQPHSEENKQVMKRFASAFSLTFRRYQDLKKAEAQAREATIEAALEKVRGKAMAMHNSSDVLSTASMVFVEIRQLGIQSIRCGVGLLTRNNRYARMHAGTTTGNNDSLSLMGEVELSGHPCYDKQYEAFLTGKDYYGMLEGEDLKSYYEVFRKKLSALPAEAGIIGKEYCYYLPFSEGILYSWSDRAYTENEVNILSRFKSIIDLTFRRYIELQKSEANAKEAVKQAALDRIRADIASMRTLQDLNRIIPLIWNELTILGLPFIRCGVFLMDDSQQLIHTFLSTPEGKAIAAFHLPYDTPGNFEEMIRNWRNKTIFIDHWAEKEFTNLADILEKQGSIPSKEKYPASLPEGGFYLHFVPFLQGMLYVGNIIKLGNEELSLIESVADAFSTAYARYEDFNNLEAAKQQVDKTLVDLKQTQQQLVQSEKMASLGELTAGIAHEIQNPLNFVNNFSEVNKELISELREALRKGEMKEVEAIASDIEANEEKIGHHGKRADGIVKSMLQHSRTSSEKKEPTDINALCDEYFRLAYHGLRAKDKSFNATMKTEFDNGVGKLTVFPQEMGRVILNLITNAFYAVSERKKLLSANGGIKNYEPTVSVSTKAMGDKVEIRVVDNGTGIPQKALDKIFQPFFTTKPTGQGTGLGLSLSYDIVTKGHGGELKVETKEQEGSEFIIQLPNQ